MTSCDLEFFPNLVHPFSVPVRIEDHTRKILQQIFVRLVELSFNHCLLASLAADKCEYCGQILFTAQHSLNLRHYQVVQVL